MVVDYIGPGKWYIMTKPEGQVWLVRPTGIITSTVYGSVIMGDVLASCGEFEFESPPIYMPYRHVIESPFQSEDVDLMCSYVYMTYGVRLRNC